MLPRTIPKQLALYFQMGEGMMVEKVRRFFRAIGKKPQIRKNRARKLKSLYKKMIKEQLPADKDQLTAWFSKEGIRLATETLHLYPLFFEDRVHELMQAVAQ